MLEIYVIRHGLAGKSLEDEEMDDERPLKKKGKEQIRDVAKGLKDLKVSFGHVFTSPLPRAFESAEIINKYCGDNSEATITDLLLPDASADKLVRFLNKFKDADKIAIVGHEPFLSGFSSYCLTKSKSSFINLKKGGVLVLEIDGTIKPGRCQLSWLMEPGHLA